MPPSSCEAAILRVLDEEEEGEKETQTASHAENYFTHTHTPRALSLHQRGAFLQIALQHFATLSARPGDLQMWFCVCSACPMLDICRVSLYVQ